jgi:hypothetical protein
VDSLIRFVWTRLIHAPCPSKLVYVETYRTGCLINSYSDHVSLTSKDSESDVVRLLISVSFDSQWFSPSFSYQNRTIATPFLSTVGLEDPIKDRRLLGNCVYCPILEGFGSWSFSDFFTGASSLGFYDFRSASFGSYREQKIFSRHAVVKYYLVDTSSLEKRISRFFDGYDQASIFAERLFTESGKKEESFFPLPLMIRSCIRSLKHPIGIFACVRTMVGSINASELLFEFRRRLMFGGGS